MNEKVEEIVRVGSGKHIALLGYTKSESIMFPSCAQMQIYDDNPHIVDAPELHEVQQWLREEHKIDVISVRSFTFSNSYYYEIISHGKEVIQSESNHNISYEQALKTRINEALKMIYLWKLKKECSFAA